MDTRLRSLQREAQSGDSEALDAFLRGMERLGVHVHDHLIIEPHIEGVLIKCSSCDKSWVAGFNPLEYGLLRNEVTSLAVTTPTANGQEIALYVGTHYDPPKTRVWETLEPW